MNAATFLQAFLIIDVFFVGVLVSVAVQHAIAHRQSKKQPAPSSAPVTANKDYVPPMMREQLVQQSQAKFQDALNNSATQLQNSLGVTASQLDQLLKQLGAEIVGNELERYRADIAKLRQQAQADMGAIKTDIDAHRSELEAQMQQQLTAEKERLLKQIDTKLADAVSSFLIETLQHNVDLGAQEAYLKTMLEEHKADFIKEVADEPRPTK